MMTLLNATRGGELASFLLLSNCREMIKTLDYPFYREISISLHLRNFQKNGQF